MRQNYHSFIQGAGAEAEALIAESATKIEELENKLEELKKENETIETKCKSTEETLSKYKDQTREILRKSKEKITDTVKGTFLSEGTDVFVITPNKHKPTFFFPETENLNFGDLKLLRN